jgi:hypothetical protein
VSHAWRASHTSAKQVMSLGKSQKRNVVMNGGHVIMRNRVTQRSLQCAASSSSSRIVDRSAGETEESVGVFEGSQNGDWGRCVELEREERKSAQRVKGSQVN